MAVWTWPSVHRDVTHLCTSILSSRGRLWLRTSKKDKLLAAPSEVWNKTPNLAFSLLCEKTLSIQAPGRDVMVRNNEIELTKHTQAEKHQITPAGTGTYCTHD